MSKRRDTPDQICAVDTTASWSVTRQLDLVDWNQPWKYKHILKIYLVGYNIVLWFNFSFFAHWEQFHCLYSFCPFLPGLQEAHDAGLTIFHAGTAIQDSQLVASGGRVLAVVAKEKDFQTAQNKAQQGAELIQFTDAFYRKDIGYKILTR